MSYIRSFVGLDLPNDLKKELGSFQEILKKHNFDIRWSKPANFHLNLLFLGETPEATLEKLTVELQKRIKIEPFELLPSHLDYLYKRHTDSIIYIALKGDLEKLKELQGQVRRSVELAANYTTTRRFLPHITIGRIKPGVGQPEKKLILSKIINFQPKKLSPFTVSEVKIMRSDILLDTTYTHSSVSTIPIPRQI